VIVCLVGVLSHLNYLEDARNHKPKIQLYWDWDVCLFFPVASIMMTVFGRTVSWSLNEVYCVLLCFGWTYCVYWRPGRSCVVCKWVGITFLCGVPSRTRTGHFCRSLSMFVISRKTFQEKPVTLLGSETAVLAKSACYTELFVGQLVVCGRCCCRILRHVWYSVRHLRSSAFPSQSVFYRWPNGMSCCWTHWVEVKEPNTT
jgi:hypothetical protein